MTKLSVNLNKVALLRNQVRQQGIGGDVEGHAQENIRRALIELTRQFSISDIKLKKTMARRERHFIKIRRVPRRHHKTPRVGIAFNLVDHPLDLINRAAIRLGP